MTYGYYCSLEPIKPKRSLGICILDDMYKALLDKYELKLEEAQKKMIKKLKLSFGNELAKVMNEMVTLHQRMTVIEFNLDLHKPLKELSDATEKGNIKKDNRKEHQRNGKIRSSKKAEYSCCSE